MSQGLRISDLPKDLKEEACAAMFKQMNMEATHMNRIGILKSYLMQLFFKETDKGEAYWENVYNEHSLKPYRDIHGSIGGTRVSGEKSRGRVTKDEPVKQS